ncbi:phosphonoacetate hydrolase [Pedobacter hartonius]|uniref:Phosphonoacetate hydrolase n=2 Tax=Pedobacter hartonius TaxID=425514 RepID=A0A1H4GZ44_9SPHI|nr:phosphonoacetate hydrolase [Pedobacter hartonius]
MLEEQLLQRSENKCELCQSGETLKLYAVPPQSANNVDNCIIVCDTCLSQIEKNKETEKNHWRCLTTSMWSELAAVQVVSWRMLNRLSTEGWAVDNLDMMYLDDETLAWAKAAAEDENDEIIEIHKDCNGSPLLAGDSIVLTKSLDVKGSTLNAKLGTVVKNIRLVENNTDQIEGKIEGQVIVILTKYVRKQG